MAEALGVIASAVQIADTSIKLRKLWIGIKEMPDTVRDMIEDIDLLANTLAQIQNVPILSSPAQQNTIAWKECCRTLEKVNTSFQAFVSDLDKHMAAHKKSGSIKAFLKREKLIEWQDRLSRLKMTMLMAQQAYTQVLFAQQCSTILDTLQTIRTPQPAGPPTLQPIAKTRQVLDDGQVCTSSCLSVAKVADSSSTKRLQQQAKRKFDVRLPDWVLRRGLQILVGRSYGSWTFNLRVYNRVSHDSEVFVAARQGEWTKVQSLFDQRRASPFDMREDGYTLMHVAASNADVYGCRFLLDHSLEPQAQTGWIWSPLKYLSIIYSANLHEPTHVEQVVSLLAPSFEEHMVNNDGALIDFINLPTGAVRCLTTAVSSSYNTIEPLRRAKSLALSRREDPESIPLILGTDLSLPRAFALLYENSPDGCYLSHRTIFGHVATSLGRVMSNDDAIQTFIDEWRHIVTDVITFERQVNKPLSFRSFIRDFITRCLTSQQFSLGLHEHGSIWSQKLTSAVRVWIKFLDAMGVDLDNYAKAEKQCFMIGRQYCIVPMWSLNYFRPLRIRLHGLTCGPNIDDWSLCTVTVDNPRSELCGEDYEMAGSFWAWIENPELFFIPGSYPDQFDEPIGWKPCMIKGPIL